MLDTRIVNVRPSRLSVAAGGEDLEDSASELHQSNVVGAAAEAEDHDFHLLVCLVKPVGKTGGCGLVYDPVDFEPCNLPRVLRGLTLVIVEVGGDSYDGLFHGPSQKRFCV